MPDPVTMTYSDITVTLDPLPAPSAKTASLLADLEAEIDRKIMEDFLFLQVAPTVKQVAQPEPGSRLFWPIAAIEA